MRLASISAFPLRIPRDSLAAAGTAGSPTSLAPGTGSYHWSSVYPCLYSSHFETTVIRVQLDSGETGWGEAQAPLVPQVSALLAEELLVPAIVGEPFEPTPRRISELWWRMYSAMRVRGHTGGFLLDAISGVDIALWDLAGKLTGKPVAHLLAGDQPLRTRIPAYVSGLSGAGPSERAESAARFMAEGFSAFKLFYDSAEQREFLHLVDAVQAAAGKYARVAIDALWRFTPDQAHAFGRELDARDALWFEAPLAPESPREHALLAEAIRTPVAIGESYRSMFEIEPFFDAGAVEVLQPDLGRSGITETRRMAERATAGGIPVVPHVSIAFGPQVAAALHFAAAEPGCYWVEYNPAAMAITNRFLKAPLTAESGHWHVPEEPGLGIELDVSQLIRFLAPPRLSVLRSS